MAEVTRIAEQTIRRFGDFNNGAGPLWCFGSRTIVRAGDTVFASVADVDPAAKPLCNTRWHLYRRKDGGAWELARSQEKAGEREPCPIVLQPGGRIILSANTALAPRWEAEDGTFGFSCEPHLLEFYEALGEPPRKIAPWWDADYPCFEHSYRGFAADPAGGLFLTQQVQDGETYSQAWCYREADGAWAANGLLRFPMRGCYPAIAVNGAAVHVMAISDEIEPNEEWRAHKKAVTGRSWDYDFRQLYYTWSPNVRTTPFSPPLTVASADETCGHILHTDLFLDEAGEAHLLYIERNVWHPFVRDRFFPAMPITVRLRYARVRRGRVVERRTLLDAEEIVRRGNSAAEPEMSGPVPTWAAFHPVPDGRVFVVWFQQGKSVRSTGNFIRRILPRADGASVKLPLKRPLSRFFTSAPRAGCPPSNILDLYGTSGDERLIRYAQVKVA